MRYSCRVFDGSGRESAEVVEAANPLEATEKLRGRDLYAAEVVKLADAPTAPSKRRWLPVGRTGRLKQTALFTRQLYMLVHTGTPLAEGLRLLERQTTHKEWRAVVANVGASLESGCPLSEAMKPHPEYFDPIYRNMVAAGESSGKLPVMLNRLADLMRKQVHVRSTIRGAMVYPCLLVLVALGVLSMLMVFVIPKFSELFDTLGAPMPATTVALLSLSKTLRSYWWAFLGGLIALVWGVRVYLRSPGGRYFMDTLVLRLPKVGTIVRNLATARIARLIGVLSDSYLPILEVLRLTRSAVPNVHYARLICRAEEAVTRGEPISSVFAESDLITTGAGAAIRSGEQSGQLGPLLLDLAGFLDEENEVHLKMLTALLEPAILILMGVVVGFVAVSIFLPLFDVGSMAGGGPR